MNSYVPIQYLTHYKNHIYTFYPNHQKQICSSSLISFSFCLSMENANVTTCMFCCQSYIEHLFFDFNFYSLLLKTLRNSNGSVLFVLIDCIDYFSKC